MVKRWIEWWVEPVLRDYYHNLAAKCDWLKEEFDKLRDRQRKLSTRVGELEKGVHIHSGVVAEVVSLSSRVPQLLHRIEQLEKKLEAGDG